MKNPKVVRFEQLHAAINAADSPTRQRIFELLDDLLFAIQQGLIPQVNRSVYRSALGLDQEHRPAPALRYPPSQPPLIK